MILGLLAGNSDLDIFSALLVQSPTTQIAKAALTTKSGPNKSYVLLSPSSGLNPLCQLSWVLWGFVKETFSCESDDDLIFSIPYLLQKTNSYDMVSLGKKTY